MASDTSKTKFSTNIIAITGLIGAIAGLITVLHTTGVINVTGRSNDSTVEKEKIEVVKPNDNPKVEVIIKQEEQSSSPVKTINTISPTIEQNPVIKVQETPPVETYKSINLTGYWYENMQGSRYYFKQNNYGNITFQEYGLNEFGVAFVSAEGTGTIQNNILNISFLSYLGVTGTLKGNIINNGNSIDCIANIPSLGKSLRVIMNRE